MAGFGKEDLGDLGSSSVLLCAPGQGLVDGLLKEVIDIGGQDGKPKIYEHIFVRAASNEYEHPKTYSVRSEKILGPVGQIYPPFVCEMRTWRKNNFINTNLWVA